MLDLEAVESQAPCKTSINASDKAKLLILSNCNILRTGLAKALASWSFQKVDTARVDDVEKLKGSGCNVLLFDMPSDADVDEIFRGLTPLLRHIPCVVLTESFSFDVYVASRRHHAGGYLLKDTPLSALQVALLLVLEGKDVFPNELALPWFSTMVLESPRTSARKGEPEPKYRKLSHQEMKILAFLAHGDSNKLIARRLGNCEATVKVQMKAIFRKLGFQNRTQAAVWAVKNGFDATRPTAESGRQPNSLWQGKLEGHPRAPGTHGANKWLIHQ